MEVEEEFTSTLHRDEEQGHSPEASGQALPRIADYYKWSADQAQLIREGRFHLVDKLNVADEIEDVGKRERRSLVSGLEHILTHVLKWIHQPRRRSRSWQISIVEHRRRVIDDLEENPSLDAQRDALREQAYTYARYGAAKQIKLPLRTFPVECPYTWSQIMEAPYELDGPV